MTIEAKIDETNELLRKILSVLIVSDRPEPDRIEEKMTGGTITIEKVTVGNSTTELANPVKVTPGETITLTVDRGTPEPTPALEYERDVKPLVLQVSAKKGRETCTKMLGEFGLTTAKDAKPEQFADIVVKCKELLA